MKEMVWSWVREVVQIKVLGSNCWSKHTSGQVQTKDRPFFIVMSAVPLKLSGG